MVARKSGSRKPKAPKMGAHKPMMTLAGRNKMMKKMGKGK